MKAKNVKQDSSATVEQIFDDLDNYKSFCVDYGYRYDEKDLYNMRVYAYQQFHKKSNDKRFKDQLGVDLARQFR